MTAAHLPPSGLANIVFLSFYSGHVARGVETYVHCLANELVKIGHQVTVFQNGPAVAGSNYQTVSLGMEVDWSRSGGGESPFNDYWKLLIRKFSQAVFRRLPESTDIVIPTNGVWQSWLAKLWAVRHGKKVIIAGQSGPGRDDIINLYAFPDRFISLTAVSQKWARKINPFVQVETIPNGVDLKTFTPTVKPEKVDLPGKIVLSVAALVPAKRLDLLIHAVSRVPGTSLWLVGDGEQKNALQTLASSMLPGRFLISSFPHQHMPHVYPAADVFAFPTNPRESFGIVMLEAMASGLPVVAAPDPIRREIVQDAGVFADPQDSAAFTKALTTALNHSWGELPRRRAADFSWSKIASHYSHIFQSL